MATGAALEMAGRTESDGAVSKAMKQMRQFICGLHGHDALLHFESGRLSLQCASCGYETPGWNLDKAASRTRETESKARVLRLPIVRERRVA